MEKISLMYGMNRAVWWEQDHPIYLKAKEVEAFSDCCQDSDRCLGPIWPYGTVPSPRVDCSWLGPVLVHRSVSQWLTLFSTLFPFAWRTAYVYGRWLSVLSYKADSKLSITPLAPAGTERFCQLFLRKDGARPIFFPWWERANSLSSADPSIPPAACLSPVLGLFNFSSKMCRLLNQGASRLKTWFA